MQGPSWIDLLSRIPAKLHDSLAVTLVTGAEILMQSILRLESDYAIIRGRMSGSTDAGKVLILPYDQLVNLFFTKRMLEAEVEAVFGKIQPSAAAQAAESPAAEVADAEQEAAAKEEAPTQGMVTPMRTAALNTAPPPPPPAPTKGQAPPSKSILLARLRARLAEQGK